MVFSHVGEGVLLPKEKNPKGCIKHKLHIAKVMFLCAVVRPQYNPCAESWWDGKLGIWPIGDWEPAKKSQRTGLREQRWGRTKS